MTQVNTAEAQEHRLERVRTQGLAPSAAAAGMDLLDFARGPALVAALTVFSLVTLWRLGHVLTRPRRPDLSPPREGAPSAAAGAGRAVLRGLWPRREFGAASRFATLNGYAFHLGLALVVFGYAPHIAFIHRLTGLGWPALPDAAMYLASAATLVSLLLAMLARVTDPVLQLISTRDDHISWALTLLPVFTGMAVLSEPSAVLLARDHATYRGPLAIHLLSLELLLLWFPFGKLMHAVLFVFSRGATGVRFSHRGVRI
jgi:nitrate reductase gamma subunit